MLTAYFFAIRMPLLRGDHHIGSSLSALGCGIALAFLLAFPAVAQDKDALPPVSDTYALTGLTLIPSPGQKIENGTLVIKDGLIAGVGSDIPIPSEAIVIHADSLFAYAGFIDGYSHTGVRATDSEDTPGLLDPKLKALDEANITPQRSALETLAPADKSIGALRDQGFTVAQVAPQGRVLPGKASIVMLGGSTVDEMALTRDAALYTVLEGVSGVYPSTIMGVMATWRELYRQAYFAREYEARYAENAIGRERPPYNHVWQALYPVLEKKIPVLVKTEKVLEAQRAFSLKDELGFRLAIANLKEGWPIADRVKASGAAVFLSLELPKEQKKAKKDSAKETSEERKHLLAQQKTSIDNYVGQAATFSKKGIPFGFSTGDVKPRDIHDHLVRIVDAGLSPRDALAALTVVPARLMGLQDRLGSLEKGKIANVVVSDKPYFEKEARIQYVFVDGKKYEIKKKKKKSKGGKVDAEGKWSFVAEPPGGNEVRGRLTLRKDAAKNYSGTITNSETKEESPIEDFSLDDDAMSFTFVVTIEGNPVELTFEGALEGDTFEGTLSAGDEFSFPIKGDRQPESSIQSTQP